MGKDILKDLCVVAVICIVLFGAAFLLYEIKEQPSSSTDTIVRVQQDANEPNVMRPPKSWTDPNTGL